MCFSFLETVKSDREKQNETFNDHLRIAAHIHQDHTVRKASDNHDSGDDVRHEAMTARDRNAAKNDAGNHVEFITA